MKKLFSLPAILLLFQHYGYAQKKDQESIDSLLTELTKAKEDTTKLKLFAAIMSAHVEYKPAEGLTYQKAALELAQKTKSKIGVARIKERIGRLNWRMGNFDEALKNHFEALDIYMQTDSKYFAGDALVEIGQDYVDNGKYPEAMIYLLKALKVSEEVGDKITMSAAYDVLSFLYEEEGNIAESVKTKYAYLKINEQIGSKGAIAHALAGLALNFQALGNDENALKYFKQGAQAAKEAGDKMEEANMESSLGNLSLNHNNFPEAMKCYSAALGLANETGDVPLLALMHQGIGDLYRIEGNYPEALNNYLFAAAKFKSVANKQDLASVYSEMGITYTHLKKYAEAKKSLNEAKDLAKALNSKVAMREYYGGMVLLDSATGNWKDAYQNHKQYIIVRDSIFNQETLKKLVASQIRYEDDKKAAIERAKQEKKDVVAREEVKRQRNIRNSAFAVLAVVLLFSFVIYRQRNRIAGEKKRSDLLVTDKEMLIKEIHHRVKNNLEVISSLLELQSEGIDDENAKAAIIEGQSRVQSIALIHHKLYRTDDLSSVELKGFANDLFKQVSGVFKKPGAEIDFRIAASETQISIDTAVPLGLILNELLTNTFKYAIKKGIQNIISIQLNSTGEDLYTIVYKDNGPGLPAAFDIQRSNSLGMKVIQLLTKQLGGTLNFYNDNGSVFEIPFKMVASKQSELKSALF